MKEKLFELVMKVKENKAVVIKVAAILAGAALGAFVATVIENAQQQYEYSESELLGLGEEDLEEESDEETDEVD